MSISFKSAKHIHFTGIKGVGMTATAICAQDLNISISGSDVPEDFVTADVLNERNITVSQGFEASHLPDNTDLLIYTGAHNANQNPQVVAAEQRGVAIISQAEAVGQLMTDKIGVSVCGVGGKTTTSAMIANVLDYANKNPSFLIGVGKVLNLQVPGKYTSGEHFIAEADEYALVPGIDPSPRFLFQKPHIIACTNVVHDHPDQYPDITATKKAFIQFFQSLKPEDYLIANIDSPALAEIINRLDQPRILTYGQSDQAMWQITDSFVGQDKQLITVKHQDQNFNFTLPVPGMFNAMNALAAYLCCISLSIDHQTVLEGLQLFRGSKRRFEKVGEYNKIPLYDDYAHHPTQVKATLLAAKQWLPLKQVVALFQPHTFSRTKALFDDFAQSFTHADRVIITDIYASAREQLDDTISGYALSEAVKKYHSNVEYVPYKDLKPYLIEHLTLNDALFTLGAGDIYHIHDQLLPNNL